MKPLRQQGTGGVDAFDLVESQQNDAHGEPLPFEMSESDGHLRCDAREHGDHCGVACQPWFGLDQELVEREAVGQLDAGEDLANPRETSAPRLAGTMIGRSRSSRSRVATVCCMAARLVQ